MTTLDRRSVLVGACGTCAVVVAGCAAYGPGQPAPAPAPSAQSGGVGGGAGSGSGSAGGKLAATADVPVGGGVVLADAQLVITQPKAGTFKAFSAICTHQGCTVAAVENGTINCPCHGSEFAIADGAVVAGPAPKPLPAKSIKVSGGSITAA
jgi:nitrite reductase/ring-hydroxylating ferredoxin subunit